MASYTMQLREYIESWSEEGSPINEVIETGRPKLFSFNYPLFTPDYKKDFETKFIRNFYFTEIGFETEELFKFKLENWLNINMDYFNNLFKSELLTFDPLTNTKVTTTDNRTKDKTQNDVKDVTQTSTKNDERDITQSSTTNGSSNTTNDGTSSTDVTAENDSTETVGDTHFNRNIESDTPDSRLSITPNEDGSGVISYASKITENKESDTRDVTKATTATNNSDTTDHATSETTANSESSGTSNDTLSSETSGTSNETLTSTINETENDTINKSGKTGNQTYSQMLQEYRETFLRIEKQIFEEMRKELFMLVY